MLVGANGELAAGPCLWHLSISSATRSPNPPTASHRSLVGKALTAEVVKMNNNQDSDKREGRCYTKIKDSISLPFSSTRVQAEGQTGTP